VAVRGNPQSLQRGTRHPKRVKALAYAYASEGAYSPEMEKLKRIDRFGLEAVTGRRVFYFSEIRRLIYAENIVNAYESRAQSKNWVEWATSRPRMAEILAEAERLAND
jgi:hypothetical protein